MPQTLSRRLLWAFASLLLLAAVGYARYDVYMMDGDGTAFLDIAQDLNTHHAALAVNGYWNPGYPAVLAVAERVAHPSLWRELVVVRYANVLIFALAMTATLFFTSALVRARERWRVGELPAMPAAAVHLLALGLLTLSLGRELPVAAPRADTLLLALLMLAAGLCLRLLTGAGLWMYPVLGVVLGAAYLTKSFAFLPSLALLAALAAGALLARAHRGRAIAGVLLTCMLFAAVAGPYIFAISRQVGHLTTGESARLNYAFFVDLTPRWHEWFHGDLGHATGPFLHAEAPLVRQPTVFSFAAHPYGTFPLWFDPAWWTLGLKPHIWLKGHALRAARNVVVFARYLLGRPEIFVLLAVLCAFGARWKPAAVVAAETPRQRWIVRAWWLGPLAWGTLMLAIYFPIDLQDRYLTAPLFLTVLPLFAALRARDEERWVPVVGSALVLLFAASTLSQTATYLADRRRHTPPAEQRHAGFDPQIFTAAAALDALGLKPGDKIACMGDAACYTDHYWARLAGTQILAQVDTPDEANPISVWDAMANKNAVTEPLRRMGLRCIVSLFPNSETKPAGWVQLGDSNFFAYPLDGAAAAAEARASEAFQATP